jgi:hypothetical protein
VGIKNGTVSQLSNVKPVVKPSKKNTCVSNNIPEKIG